jgi:hypothetical protein
MPTIDEILQTKQSSMWGQLQQPLLGEKDERQLYGVT